MEALASGIPIVQSSLAERRLPPARFFDCGTRFTVVLSGRAPSPAKVPIRGPSATLVWGALAGSEQTIAELGRVTGLGEANLHRILATLRDRGVIEVRGGPGRPTTYHRTPE